MSLLCSDFSPFFSYNMLDKRDILALHKFNMSLLCSVFNCYFPYDLLFTMPKGNIEFMQCQYVPLLHKRDILNLCRTICPFTTYSKSYGKQQLETLHKRDILNLCCDNMSLLCSKPYGKYRKIFPKRSNNKLDIMNN